MSVVMSLDNLQNQNYFLSSFVILSVQDNETHYDSAKMNKEEKTKFLKTSWSKFQELIE